MKEEQIEEMTNVMFGKAMAKLEDFLTVDYIVFSDYEKYELRKKIKGALNLYAGALYESGYRKADEVRKETAQKVIKPYQHERFGKNGQTYSLKCGRCNKTVQTKWNYCPFCGTKLREVEE